LTGQVLQGHPRSREVKEDGVGFRRLVLGVLFVEKETVSVDIAVCDTDEVIEAVSTKLVLQTNGTRLVIFKTADTAIAAFLERGLGRGL
jgi:hypothetical protein